MLNGECGMMNSNLPTFPPNKGALFKQSCRENVKVTNEKAGDGIGDSTDGQAGWLGRRRGVRLRYVLGTAEAEHGTPARRRAVTPRLCKEGEGEGSSSPPPHLPSPYKGEESDCTGNRDTE